MLKFLPSEQEELTRTVERFARILLKSPEWYKETDKRVTCQSILFNLNLRIARMTKRKEQPKPEKPPFKGFINFRLEKSEKKLVDEWPMSMDELCAMLENLIADRIKVSLGYDAWGQCSMVSLTDQHPDSDTVGWVVTSRAGTVLDCVRLALYKHFVVMERDWSEYLPDPEALPDVWG